MNQNRISLKSTIRTMDIPRLSLREFKAICEIKSADSVLEMTYKPFLRALHAERKRDVETVRDLVSEIVEEKFAVETDKTVRDILSGKIRLESEKDIENIPNYRKQRDDGTVEIINISEHIQPWVALQTWLNGYYETI